MKKFSFWKRITAISVISLCAIGNMFAQAPSQCLDVMLQAFIGMHNPKCNWNSLNNQSTEIAANFDLVWLAPSAKSSGVGYHPEQLQSKQQLGFILRTKKHLFPVFITKPKSYC